MIVQSARTQVDKNLPEQDDQHLPGEPGRGEGPLLLAAGAGAARGQGDHGARPDSAAGPAAGAPRPPPQPQVPQTWRVHLLGYYKYIFRSMVVGNKCESM